MFIARVEGTVTAPQKNKELEGHKLLVVQQLDLEMKPSAPTIIALDKVDAGIGDLVLVMKEGGSARIVLENNKIPVQAVVVGVIDKIDIDKELAGLR